jgi:hypothetical protein
MINWEAEIIPKFKLIEARCQHCWLVILEPDLLEKLHILRSAWGSPITAPSWTRCRVHNADVGGVLNSYHLNGRAVDLRPKILPGQIESSIIGSFAEVAKLYFPFVLRHERYIHCDVRGDRP